MDARPRYIGSEIYHGSTYGAKHPLAVPRVSTTTDLCRAKGWLPGDVYVDAPVATEAQVARFHDPHYIDALRRTEAAQSVSESDRENYRIGTDGNPVFADIFRRPMTSAGGILLAAALTSDGGTVFCPGGGTHHGRPGRAAGFCYLNDPALGILAWLDQGLSRVAYLDIDAHHGDGVQDAFAHDGRVFTLRHRRPISASARRQRCRFKQRLRARPTLQLDSVNLERALSIHEEGRWPRTGSAEDRAGGLARNFPAPAGFNDREMRALMRRAILPLINDFRPQAIFLQCGADSLEEDPLSHLALSNNAHIGVVADMMGRAERLIVTGGGGYNPSTVARCWACVGQVK